MTECKRCGGKATLSIMRSSSYGRGEVSRLLGRAWGCKVCKLQVRVFLSGRVETNDNGKVTVT